MSSMSPWRATVLTLFPEMFPGTLGGSLAGKALARGIWELDARDIRAADGTNPDLNDPDYTATTTVTDVRYSSQKAQLINSLGLGVTASVFGNSMVSTSAAGAVFTAVNSGDIIINDVAIKWDETSGPANVTDLDTLVTHINAYAGQTGVYADHVQDADQNEVVVMFNTSGAAIKTRKRFIASKNRW